MAIRSTFARLALYSRKFSKAYLIFLQKVVLAYAYILGKYHVMASGKFGESEQIWLILMYTMI